MGKQTIVTCDLCGKNLANSDYVVFAISTVRKGTITKQPSVWCCPTCWMKTGLLVQPKEDEK